MSPYLLALILFSLGIRMVLYYDTNLPLKTFRITGVNPDP